MKKLLSLSKIVLSVALIAATVAVAHAWTAPTQPATGGNVPAPVNTGSVPQTKNANLSIVGNLNAWRGFFSQLVNSPKARFGCFLLTCSSTTLTSSNIFEAGAYDGSGMLSSGLTSSTTGVVSVKNNPLFVNLMGVTGSQGRNALQVLVDNGNLTNTAGAVLMTNSDKFSLFNSAGTNRVGLAVKDFDATGAVKLSGAVLPGAALTPGMVLTNLGGGVAVWSAPAPVAAPVVATSTTEGLITYVRKLAADTATAVCPSDSIAIAGGGNCEWGMKSSESITADGNPPTMHLDNQTSSTPAVGWSVRCLQGAKDPIGAGQGVIVQGPNKKSGLAVAEAVCMKKTPFVTSVGTTPIAGVPGGGSAGGGTTPPPYVAKWHSVTAIPDGTAGQSCQAWLTANNAAIQTQVTAGGGGTFTATNGSSGNMRAQGDSSYQSAPNTAGNCAYTGSTPTGLTYCGYKPSNAPQSIVNYGNTVSLKPTASCSGLEFALDPADPVIGNYRTEIKW